MVLTERQKEELHNAIYDYFKELGFSSTMAEFAREARINPDNTGPSGMLEKKWTSLLRLQRKVTEVEQKLDEANKELARLQGGRREAKNPNNLPLAAPLCVLRGHRSPVTCVRFHPEWNVLVTAAEDATAKVWDSETGQYERTLKGHTDAVFDVAFDTAGTLLATCSADNTIKLWNFKDNYTCIRTLYGHEHSVTSVVFSPSGLHLISASRDKSIKVWEIATGYCHNTLMGHDEWVRRVIVHPCGRLIASCSSDQTCRVWDPDGTYALGTMRDHTHVVECIAFAPPAMEAVLRDMNLTGDAILPGQEYRQASSAPPASTADGTAASSSPSPAAGPVQAFLLSGSRDRTIKIWNTFTCQCLLTLVGHDNWVRSVIGHPNGNFLISVADDKSIRVWELRSQRCIKVYSDSHSHFISSAHFHPRIPMLATGSVDQSVKIWDCR
eukprot:gnl/Spiro4/26016_TR12956_c0_g1_i1.p2 gnl/Spiro4/26016_TR12956_c0_g1~~gnl/Spiro4/26016_TR12956_c0_g1_i1.p2  ORF type:complete len:440 (+),score=150.20 gnl/Spiro4/26016_TR12956_c0_g1_i1:97-1416(+)